LRKKEQQEKSYLHRYHEPTEDAVPQQKKRSKKRRQKGNGLGKKNTVAKGKNRSPFFFGDVILQETRQRVNSNIVSRHFAGKIEERKRKK